MIGAWDWDIANDRVICNERFAEFYGVDPVQAAAGVPIGKFLASVHPEDRPALSAAMRRAAAKPLRLAALTGYGRQAGVAAHSPGDAAAFDLHLTKPASVDDLRRALGANASAPAD